jgi:hypothetical protein
VLRQIPVSGSKRKSQGDGGDEMYVKVVNAITFHTVVLRVATLSAVVSG